jgi:hypothetical protein
MSRFPIKGAATRKKGLPTDDDAYPFGRKADRLTVAGILLVAILLALNFMFRFPDLGAIISEFNRF